MIVDRAKLDASSGQSGGAKHLSGLLPAALVHRVWRCSRLVKEAEA